MGKPVRFAVLLVVFLYGCAPVWLGVGAGVGIGTYKYIEGNLERDYPFSYKKAWDTTNEALANLKISISSSLKEGDSGTIEAVRKDGKKVAVQLKDRGQNITSIAIRVGTFGDRDASEKIHEEIARIAEL